jgi:hypothetical protein
MATTHRLSLPEHVIGQRNSLDHEGTRPIGWTWAAGYSRERAGPLFNVQISRALTEDQRDLGDFNKKGMIQVSQPISEHDAPAQKRSIHPHSGSGKQWHFANFATVQAAITFVNASPAQVAGEISATARNDGTVGLFYFL